MYTKVLFYIDHFKCFNIAMMTKVCCNDCNEWTTSAVQWIVLARIMKCHRTKMSVQCDHCPGRARTRGTTHLQARPADCSAGVYRCGGGATRHPPLAATPLLSCSWHLRSSVELSHRPRLSPTTRTPHRRNNTSNSSHNSSSSTGDRGRPVSSSTVTPSLHCYRVMKTTTRTKQK